MNPETAIKKERISFFKSHCAALGTFFVFKSPEKAIVLFFRTVLSRLSNRVISMSKYDRKCLGVNILREFPIRLMSITKPTYIFMCIMLTAIHITSIIKLLNLQEMKSAHRLNVILESYFRNKSARMKVLCPLSMNKLHYNCMDFNGRGPF